jgi:DNA repair photolyase
LMGIGAFATGPKDTADYRRGYLCGLIRGDAHIGSYRYQRVGRTNGDVHRFRLALADGEALQRCGEYLLEAGVAASEFLFQAETPERRRILAIRPSAKEAVAAVGEMIRWPTSPSGDWRKGFLAGIFDAEGSCSRGFLRISNTDTETLHHIATSLRRFKFSYVFETRRGPNPVTTVRLIGGLRERLRFFHSFDPAVTRKRRIDGVAIKTNARLGVVSVESLGFEVPMYDMTTGTGDFVADGIVSHNCFARVTHTYMDMNAGRDFESKIVVKVNAPELLRRELRARKWKGEPIAMGTATDPYQRAEGRYRLMRGIIESLTEFRNPFSILTKGTLILRDLDLLEEAAAVMDVTTALSVGTVDEEVWRKSEPGTPHPRKRLETVARLNDSGIPCGVMVAPILPGISDSDDQLRAVITAALDAGATHVSPILLHLRPGVREVYMDWLREAYPDLVPRYESMYRTAYASPADRATLGERVNDITSSVGPRHQKGPLRARARRQRPRRARAEIERLEVEQLKLL